MPGKVILIAGYPGSGKSIYGNQLKSAINAVGYVDDYHANAINDNPAFDHGRKYEEMITGLERDETWIASDIKWCEQARRDAVERGLQERIPDVIIEWHFIECDEDICCKRVWYRGYEEARKELQNITDSLRKQEVWANRCDKVKEQLENIAMLSREGNIPPNAKVIPSY